MGSNSPRDRNYTNWSVQIPEDTANSPGNSWHQGQQKLQGSPKSSLFSLVGVRHDFGRDSELDSNDIVDDVEVRSVDTTSHVPDQMTQDFYDAWMQFQAESAMDVESVAGGADIPVSPDDMAGAERSTPMLPDLEHNRPIQLCPDRQNMQAEAEAFSNGQVIDPPDSMYSTMLDEQGNEFAGVVSQISVQMSEPAAPPRAMWLRIMNDHDISVVSRNHTDPEISRHMGVYPSMTTTRSILKYDNLEYQTETTSHYSAAPWDQS